MSITSVRLQPDVEKPLEELARRQDRSKSYLINQAVREDLARQNQEQQRWEETLVAIDSARDGRRVDGEAVKAWVASWGTDNELDPPPR